jgi:hypothetical protein
LVPKKLRLILDTMEMRELLGDDVVFVLLTLIGVLTSLNLRNLV